MNRREVAARALVSVGAMLVALSLPLLRPGHSMAPATTTATSALVAATGATALIGCALLASMRPPASSMGPLAAAAAVVWVSPSWVGWAEGPPLVRSVGELLVPFAAPVLLHVVVAAPRGRIDGRGARSLVATVYTSIGLAVATLALVRDPFLDRLCSANCTANVFLVVPLPRVAALLRDAVIVTTTAVAVLGVVLAGTRLIGSARAARADTARVVAPAALALLAGASGRLLAPGAMLGRDHVGVHRLASVTEAAALTLLGAGIAWSVLIVRARRRRVARLAHELGASPMTGSLRRALAAILDDPTLDVLYPLAGSTRHVDATGEPRELTLRPDRAVTEIRRGENTVAVVVHDIALRGDPRLADYLGTAARLAIDNERLQADVLARLRELRESRARIVEAADAARRAVERNLHDGAQQSLVALLYELTLARLHAERAGEPAQAADIAATQRRAAEIAERLRSIAHGPIPAILDHHGLEAALRTLAEESTVPTDVRVGFSHRLPLPVERAAYVVVARSVEAGDVARGSVHASVTLDRSLLTVSVNGNAPDDIEALRDRVGALGGSITATDGGLQAVIPCA
ncbi:hypothetical protein Xcel_0245 [Xylanimonas cellulosilytica DSM 15894]|uniref:Signal transduction histidine kinase subgroup 3 dimerisation and phosphoacceptor domain-containing protein n=1 Tax=Xylanimonas cellulosilytica (strain DSM 15894 / JCM 12276 / CECT 5975 / KCTC 9989 / LMG 20990 / NBRC 107835 / XIL07) TaxID=446471 RepID=D1BUP3_XYLCX|nr:hypothetical protein [Xylanimonas cellulosilytica]ACZ29284.1 hypothetical protein Xcel_0245 [Xylanimonas cellulosilytica DSM 15894]